MEKNNQGQKKRIQLLSVVFSHPPSILPQISVPNVIESRVKRSVQNAVLLDGAGRSVDIICLKK